ncbi:molybdopterin-dependent oxidoreductase [Roseomonas frigidaquae]|uniref:Molybdopterin-dependent oxidoreductase n=1 Tax=Falsiroseomonas frigidaquae TaxID=487318 RepID=A0ABX1EWC8_9PROT|nr:molybdopterin-dependent oxidoreductase [Falsiroseomonas frigidaquae]NKE44195.1 molybdopterin-dependent oxidoreductase [Falsiroseomonas frigidaquae]
MRRRTLAALPLLAALAGERALAQPRPPRHILRVSGRIEGAERAFSLAELEALGMQDIATRTTWTGPDVLRFSGVPLASLLRACGASGTTLRIHALNDYAVNVPVEDATENGALLATRQGGMPLRIRDRGPIWLIYPWTERPELDAPVFRDRAIWQIRQIDVT